MNCKNCKYFDGYICMVPIWADGKYHRWQLVSEEQEACALYEEEQA